MSILLEVCGLMCFHDQWLLRAATFLECACTWLFTQADRSGCLRLGL